MIADKIACSEQFREEIAQFTVRSWDIVRKMNSRAISALALYDSIHLIPNVCKTVSNHMRICIRMEYENNSLIDCSSTLGFLGKIQNTDQML